MQLKTITTLFLFTLLCPLISHSQECISGDCDNGEGTYKWEDGDFAEGIWKDGFFTEGTLNNEGYKYEGTFKDYKLVGKGTKTWPAGFSIYGKWKDGVAIGKLLIIWDNAVMAEGKFEDARLTGKGVVTLADGTNYKGKFVDGVLQLSDTEQVDQWGTFYSGVLVDGVLVNGRTAYTSGTLETGSFVDGELHGDGLVEWGGGDVYEGVFEDGDLIEGVIIYDTGVSYEGVFKDDLLEGYGNKSIDDYYMISGMFVEGTPHGFCIITFNNGDTYEGDWVNGVLKYSKELAVNEYGTMLIGEWHGEEFISGRKYFCDGDFQTGQFKDGSMHGYGVIFDDGITYDGEWVEGYFNGYGTRTNEFGVKTTGTFYEFIINGPGTIVYNNDEEYTGNWVDGMLWVDDESLIYQTGKYKIGVFDGTELISGIIYYSDGSYREGDFEDGYLHGDGVEYAIDDYLATGSFYQGWFVEGLLERDNGVVCEGSFWGDNLDGEGSMQMPNDGDMISGIWIDGIILIGDSILAGDQGVITRGELSEDGLPHGNASFTTVDFVQTGVFYDGDIIRGTQVYTSGTTLTGEWIDDKFTSGKRVWDSGVLNEGNFLHGNLHGFGFVTMLDGTVREGDWVEGFLTLSDKLKCSQYGVTLIGAIDDFGNSEHGEVILTAGDNHTGRWLEFKLVDGIKTSKYGLVTAGAFKDTYLDGLGRKSITHRELSIECQWKEGCRVPCDEKTSELLQDFTELRIHGDVIDNNSDMSLDGAVVEVFKDGELYDFTVCDESFSLYLPGPGIYNIAISHEGYLPKSFTLDCTDVDSDLTEIISFEFTAGLYEEVDGFDMGLLLEPFGILKYDIVSDEIIVDYENLLVRKDHIEFELQRLGVDVGQ